MKSRIRIKDIAEQAGVSVGTVDRVLHKRGEVNEETRKKVMDIVEEIGYVPNLAAKTLATKKAALFVVVMPVADSEHEYWNMPLQGILRAADELKNFNVVIKVLFFDPASSISFRHKFSEAIECDPQGIIFTPVFETLSTKNAQRCAELKIPLLCLEINLGGDVTLGYFGQDAEGSGRLTGKLMEQILPENSSILLLNLARKMTITPHLRRRAKGFESYFKHPSFHKNINLVSVDLDIRDQKVLRTSLLQAFESDPGIKGIYVTSSQAHRVARSLKTIGRENMVLIGHDMIPENMGFLEEGIIDFLIVHRPHENAYQSVMGLFNHINGLKALNRVNLSSIDIVMKENMNYYINKRTAIQ